jgi:hypothetical protein
MPFVLQVLFETPQEMDAGLKVMAKLEPVIREDNNTAFDGVSCVFARALF